MTSLIKIKLKVISETDNLQRIRELATDAMSKTDPVKYLHGMGVDIWAPYHNEAVLILQELEKEGLL